MDGYIKNKQEALRSVRRTILWKYAISFPILALILIDRLWCRTDHRRIAKLHQDIEKRKQKYQKYN